MRVTTNNVPRDVVEAYELTPTERAEFDYLDWAAIERGEDSASFFRYRGNVYDLGEFSSSWGLSRESGMPADLASWHGYISDSYFSGIVVRYTDDHERVIVGTFYSE